MWLLLRMRLFIWDTLLCLIIDVYKFPRWGIKEDCRINCHRMPSKRVIASCLPECKCARLGFNSLFIEGMAADELRCLNWCPLLLRNQCVFLRLLQVFQSGIYFAFLSRDINTLTNGTAQMCHLIFTLRAFSLFHTLLCFLIHQCTLL